MILTENHLRRATFHAGTTKNDNGTVIDVFGSASVLVQITGAFSAKVNFEATVDGVNFVALKTQDVTSAEQVTYATAAGIFVMPVNGISSVRLRVSDYASGTVIAKGNISPLTFPLGISYDLGDVTIPATVTVGDPLPAGTNEIGSVTVVGNLPSFANDLRGLAVNKPGAESVDVGTTYWSIDTGVVEISDGTNWREI